MSNEIIQMDMKLLLQNSSIDKERKMIIINDNGVKLATANYKNGKKLGTVKYNCQLFDQTKKAFYKIGEYNPDLSKVFFIMDFSHCSDNYYNYLKNAVNGIELTINGEKITLVDFYKSNSMSRESRIYYINKEYYDLIDERVSFGLSKPTNKIDLSKWYAYTGLTISDCHLVEDVKFNSEEVVVVPDKERVLKTNCFSAISIPMLFNDVTDLINEFKHEDKIDTKHNFKTNYIYSKFNCYKNSDDFANLSEELKEIIDTVLFLNVDKSKYIQNLKDLKVKYLELNNATNIVWEKINLEDYPIIVNYYDGEGLISMDIDHKINIALNGVEIKLDNESDDNNIDFKSNYVFRKINHSFQIRLPFIKGVVHSCDLQKFFKEHNVKYIYGKTYNGSELRKYDVSKVKMILTESQFKMSKFIKNITLEEDEAPIDAYFRLLNKYNYSLGISNVESFSKVDYVKLCYQFFSTMPLTNYESRDVILENQKYLNLTTTNDEIINQILDVNNKYTSLLDIYEVNKNFAFNTSLFKNVKNNVIQKEKEDLVVSKMNVLGTRKFLSSDLLGLLYYVIDQDYNCELGLNSFYMPNTNLPANKTAMALLRNPHYSRNEIKMLWPETSYSERDDYFGHLTGVCMVNPLSLTAERLGGADYDGDSIIITWQPALINALYHNLYFNDNELYPLVVIPSISSNKNLNNYENRINCIKNTFKSFVGKISNQCFVESEKAYQEKRYEDIAFYTILNGLEIDSAKNGRKPVIPKSKNEDDEKAMLFIDLKKAVTNSTNTNRLLEKAKDYDGILFNNINSLNGYTVLKEDLNLPQISINKNIAKEDGLQLAAIINAYESFKIAVKKYSNFEIKYSSKNIESLLIQLNTILDRKGYKVDIQELLYNFRSDDPYKTLLDYLKDKFFYKTNNNDKDLSLIDYGFYSLSDEAKELIEDFDEDGYKLLYLILYYHKEAQTELIIRPDHLHASLNKTNLRKLDKNYKNIVINESNRIIESIRNVVRNVIGDNNLKLELIDEIDKEVTNYIKKLTTIYSIGDLNYVAHIYNTDIIYDVFFNRLIEELKQIKKGGY